MLLSETRHGSLYGEAKTITYTRDELNRSSGFQIGTAADPARDYAVRYGYDVGSRLDLAAAQGYEFRYGYVPHSNSDPVKTLHALLVKETELTYEPGRDAIASVTNRVGFNHDQLLSQYGYAINADGQRISRTTTHGGDTFTDVFGFDSDTGGLTSSKRAASVDANHAYAWDKIGNREVAVSGAKTPIAYQPNALNQYVSIEGDSSGTLNHDADGNLTRRGDHTFTWDTNNRLIAIYQRGILIARYTYDYQGRRIARWTRDGVDERYLYQGWNLIAVYHPGETEPVETYTWGKDLSGSLQGARGVGGLLFAKKRGHGQGARICHYDTNGSVTEVTDSNGNLLDHYEYDPFGQLVTEPSLPENRFRFSTKPQDAESGFYYYGFRYYDPVTGRWPSGDPIEEQGGINLYAFVGNDGVNEFDRLGLTGSMPEICCVTSLTITYNGATNVGVQAYHSFDMVAKYQAIDTTKTIAGTTYCCDPARCEFSQQIKGHYRIDGVVQPMHSTGSGAAINPNTYVDDGYSNADDTDLSDERFETNDNLGCHAGIPTGLLDVYMKFRALVNDQDGTIVADEEGYWTKIYGNSSPYSMLHGGFYRHPEKV